MSFHYTVSASINLRPDASATDVAALDWLFNANGEPPQVDPGNNDLTMTLQTLDWLQDYVRRPDPTTAVAVDFFRDAKGGTNGGLLHLFVPGQKLEAVFEDWLFAFRWLATLVRDDGFLGSVALEDGKEGMPFLFFSYGRTLHMNNITKDGYAVYSFADGARREVPPDSVTG